MLPLSTHHLQLNRKTVRDNLTQTTCLLLPTLLIPADGTTLVGSDAFSCSDKDGDTVTYALSAASTHFEVAAATGELTIKAGAG